MSSLHATTQFIDRDSPRPHDSRGRLKLFERPAAVFHIHGHPFELFRAVDEASAVGPQRPVYYYVPPLFVVPSPRPAKRKRHNGGLTTPAAAAAVVRPVDIHLDCRALDHEQVVERAMDALCATAWVVAGDPTPDIRPLPIARASWGIADPLPLARLGVVLLPIKRATKNGTFRLPARVADDGLARDLSAALQRTLLFHVDATFGAELVACAPPRPPTISRVRGMADVHDVLFDQRAWQDLVGESRKRRTVFPGRLGTVARQLTDTTFNVPMASDDGGGTAISILARRRIVRDVEAAVRFIVLSRCRKATFWRLPEICDPSFVTADAAATTLSESLAPGLPLGIVQAAAGSAAFNCFGTPSINDVDVSPAAVRSELNRLFVPLCCDRADKAACQDSALDESDSRHGHGFSAGGPVRHFRYHPERRHACPGWRSVWGWSAGAGALDHADLPHGGCADSGKIIAAGDLVRELRVRCGVHTVVWEGGLVPVAFHTYSVTPTELAVPAARGDGNGLAALCLSVSDDRSHPSTCGLSVVTAVSAAPTSETTLAMTGILRRRIQIHRHPPCDSSVPTPQAP